MRARPRRRLRTRKTSDKTGQQAGAAPAATEAAPLPCPPPHASRLDNGDGTGPAGGGGFDFDGEAGDHEPVRRQDLEVVQLLDVAVANLAAGLVAFPDQLRVFR